MLRRLLPLPLLCLSLAPASGDELSGADKLRMVWSTRFDWTRDHLPLVTVRITEGRDEIVISGAAAKAGGAASVRLLPDGEGGAEVLGGTSWRVRLGGPSTQVKLRYHVLVARGAPAEGARLQSEGQRWRDRGFSPRTFEVGTIFGIRGAVIDNRRLILTVAARDSEAEAQAEARRIAAAEHVETGLHVEVVERPGGLLEARDEKGTVVRNDSVLWFAPGDGLLAVAPADKQGGGSERRLYHGQVYVTVDGKGRLAAVNAVPEDQLLAGLLPAEIGASAPPEALKAQAVAARNELLAKIGTRHFGDPYRLCAAVHCQVYAGAGHEDPRATPAVAATRGELLVRGDGSLVDAVYSASCGGHTEDNDRAWGGAADPSLRGLLDAPAEAAGALGIHAPVTKVAEFLQPLPARPYCGGPRHGAAFRWTHRVPAATVESSAGVGPLKGLEVLRRGVSGRAVAIKLVGERGAKEVTGELTIRRALGGLKSALFTVELIRDGGGRVTELAFQGGGFGHGIGMCQSGAIGMAERGLSYRDILRHYYRGTEIRKLY